MLLNTMYYSCGSNALTGIPEIFPTLVNLIVTIVKVGVPVLLVLLGMIDMGKAVVAQKEDEIKKAQGMFFKRLIAAALVFLVFFITQMVIKIVADQADSPKIADCMDCFLNGTDSCDQ